MKCRAARRGSGPADQALPADLRLQRFPRGEDAAALRRLRRADRLGASNTMTGLLVHALLGPLTIPVFAKANAHLSGRDCPGPAQATPIAGLFLCGALCHPGPGVTFPPGYGAACEGTETVRRRAPSAMRVAA